jgi:hypothetical protein
MRTSSARLTERLARVPVAALVFSVLGIQITASHLTAPLGFYDEGLLVTDAFLLSKGQIPYRDFYANYPPGSFLLVRACSLVSAGATIHTMRVLALGIRVAGATLAAIIVGRLTRGRARVAAFAAVLLLQSRIELTMYAYVTAVALALGGVVALPTNTSRRGRFTASGVLFGLVSWFRHDLFMYGAVGAGVLALFARLAGRPIVARLPREARRSFAVGLLSAVLPFWCFVLLSGGPSQVIHDLVLDQAKYTQPARVMPLPSFKGEQGVGLFNWTIPGYLTDYVTLGLLALAFAAALGAAHVVLQVRRRTSRDDLTLTTAFLLAISVATAPQALLRTDWAHVGYGVPATVACLFGALGAIPAFSEFLVLLAFLPFVASHPGLIAPGELLARLKTRPDEDFIPPDRRAVSAAIHRLAGPDDRIFVGCTAHTRVIVSFVSVYYESRRLGATRIQQFDPGIVTRDDVQRRMIEEIESHHPAAVVLADGCYWNEPNASSNLGSDRLDRYIATHYVAVEQVGAYHIMRPR